MPQYRDRYERLAQSEWFKKHYEGKSISEEDLKLENLLEDRTKCQELISMNIDSPITAVDVPKDAIIDKSPRYTKHEIENRMYSIIDDENIFPPDEDKSAAFKIINVLLDSLK